MARGYRGQGLSAELLRAAVAPARAQGARTVEGDPKEPRGRVAVANLFRGGAAAFRRAGFVAAGRSARGRPVTRAVLAE